MDGVMKIYQTDEDGNLFDILYGCDLIDNIYSIPPKDYAINLIENMMKADGIKPPPRDSEYYRISKNRVDILCSTEKGIFAKLLPLDIARSRN